MMLIIMTRSEYFGLALDCAINGGEDRKADVYSQPTDGSYPLW